MKKMISLNQAPLRDSAGYGNKILDIPKGAVVEHLDTEFGVPYSGIITEWVKVEYRDKVGYSYRGYFDEYNVTLKEDVVDIDVATQDPYDAKQFLVWDNDVKNNMCGELACAYILGLPISKVLENWERKSPSLVARIFKGKYDVGTSADSLMDLLASFDVNKAVKFGQYFKDELLNRPVFSVQRAYECVEEKGNKIIVGVKINKRTGRLQRSGILHWVVVDGVEVNGDSGIVTLFNPFMNRFEIYSWNELVESSGNIDGIVVPFHLGDDIPEPDVEDLEWEKQVLSENVEDEIPDEVMALSQKLGILWQDYLYRKYKM